MIGSLLLEIISDRKAVPDDHQSDFHLQHEVEVPTMLNWKVHAQCGQLPDLSHFP